MVTLTLKSIFNAKNVAKSCQSLGSLYLDVIYSGWLTLLFFRHGSGLQKQMLTEYFSHDIHQTTHTANTSVPVAVMFIRTEQN